MTRFHEVELILKMNLLRLIIISALTSIFLSVNRVIQHKRDYFMVLVRIGEKRFTST